MYYPYVTFCVVGHFRNLNLQVLCFWAILQHRAWLIYLVKFAELSKIIHKCISILVLEALLTNTWQCWESHLHYTLRSGNASYSRVYTKLIECRTSYNSISSSFSYTRILEYVTLQNVKSIQIKTRSIVCI